MGGAGTKCTQDLARRSKRKGADALVRPSERHRVCPVSVDECDFGDARALISYRVASSATLPAIVGMANAVGRHIPASTTAEGDLDAGAFSKGLGVGIGAIAADWGVFHAADNTFDRGTVSTGGDGLAAALNEGDVEPLFTVENRELATVRAGRRDG